MERRAQTEQGPRSRGARPGRRMDVALFSALEATRLAWRFPTELLNASWSPQKKCAGPKILRS